MDESKFLEYLVLRSDVLKICLMFVIIISLYLVVIIIGYSTEFDEDSKGYAKKIWKYIHHIRICVILCWIFITSLCAILIVLIPSTEDMDKLFDKSPTEEKRIEKEKGDTRTEA